MTKQLSMLFAVLLQQVKPQRILTDTGGQAAPFRARSAFLPTLIPFAAALTAPVRGIAVSTLLARRGAHANPYNQALASGANGSVKRLERMR